MTEEAFIHMGSSIGRTQGLLTGCGSHRAEKRKCGGGGAEKFPFVVPHWPRSG